MILNPPTGREKAFDAFLGIRMSSALKGELEKLAKKDDRDASEYARRVLEAHVSKKRK